MNNPALSAADSAYLASTDTKPLGKRVACIFRRSYLIDLFGFQLRLALLLAAGSSFFLSTIGHVVFLITQKQMLWVAATSVVTSMKYHQTRRYRSFVDSPRQPMGKPPSNAPSGTIAYDSVTNFADFGFLPFPATVRLVDLDPVSEPIRKWNRFFHFLSLIRTGNSSYYTSLGEA